MGDDGIVRPTPPVRRAVSAVVEKLRDAGHEIVPWSPEGHAEILGVLGDFFTADGGKTVQAILDEVGEPWRPEMRAYELATEKGVADMWTLQAKRTALATAYMNRWREAGIDCLLCPTTPYATTEHGKFRYVGYTGVFNIVDYSAASFPTGVVVDAQLDKETESWEPYSEMDKQARDECEQRHHAIVLLALLTDDRQCRCRARDVREPAVNRAEVRGGKGARDVEKGARSTTRNHSVGHIGG